MFKINYNPRRALIIGFIGIISAFITNKIFGIKGFVYDIGMLMLYIGAFELFSYHAKKDSNKLLKGIDNLVRYLAIILFVSYIISMCYTF